MKTKMNTKQLTYPSIKIQEQYWKDKEAKENNATTGTRDALMYRYRNDPVFHNFVQEMIAYAIHRYENRYAPPQIPNGNASTTADPKPEDIGGNELPDRIEANQDWYEGNDFDRGDLRDEGRNPDGSGESYSERNV